MAAVRPLTWIRCGRLLSVSRLADDLPEVTGLDLDPVIVRPEGMLVVVAATNRCAPSRGRHGLSLKCVRESGGP
jgi:hypothetical protein